MGLLQLLPGADKATNDLIAGYEKAHPNVTIERTAIGFNDFRTKAIQAIATGEFPDFAFIEHGDTPVFADQGALADLTEQMSDWPEKDQYIENVFSGGVVDGKNYGVPFRTNTTTLYYNKDMFAAAGVAAPPTTWEELRETAREAYEGRPGGALLRRFGERGGHGHLPAVPLAGRRRGGHDRRRGQRQGAELPRHADQ